MACKEEGVSSPEVPSRPPVWSSWPGLSPMAVLKLTTGRGRKHHHWGSESPAYSNHDRTPPEVGPRMEGRLLNKVGAYQQERMSGGLADSLGEHGIGTRGLMF